MKIIKNRVRIEITPAERKTFDEMVVFTRKFFEQNNQCVEHKCIECPLNLFCGVTDELSRTTQNAIEEIEDFLNGGMQK